MKVLKPNLGNLCLDINIGGAVQCTSALSKLRNSAKLQSQRSFLGLLLRKFVVSHGSENPTGKSSY